MTPMTCPICYNAVRAIAEHKARSASPVSAACIGRHPCERLNRALRFVPIRWGFVFVTRLGLMVGAAMSIFISIAAYRDPELMPTIRDCIRRARYPRDLRLGVCWQHGDDEAAPHLEDHRLRVI